MKAALTLTRIFLALAGLAVAGNGLAAEKPVSGVSMMAALKDARALTANRADLKILRVEGVSMLPFFGSGAVLVVKTVSAEKLRTGMVVVYTNRFNETVAHRIVGGSASGWVAAGYNNTESDSTPVNAGNLIGVVYATFHTNGVMDETMLAAVNASAPVALAAPAR
jgi:signal peptidase I